MAQKAVTLRLTDEEVQYLEFRAAKNISYRNTIASHLLSAAIQNDMKEHQTEFDAYRAASNERNENGG